MRVWLLKTNEVTPQDGPQARLRRMALIADELANRGHDVIWWNSTFLHGKRSHRFRRQTELELRPNYRVRFLHGIGYRGSISLRRMWNHQQVARAFAVQSKKMAPPDLILASLPNVELSYQAVRYGRRMGVPVVVDLRDMWPDMFLFHVPRWTRPGLRLTLAPLFYMARQSCAQAHSLTGHTAEFVRWGLELGRRSATPFDRDFPHGYPTPGITAEQREQAIAFWERHGLSATANIPIICFFGGIGHALDMETVVKAARLFTKEREVRFVICGIGARLEALRRSSRDLKNVITPGHVGVAEIQALMEMSLAGIAPWKPTADFEATISNKVIEYWSAGIPVLTSLKRGVLVDFLTQRNCGLSYEGDPARLHQIICHLIDYPEQREAMSRVARQVFAERFSAAKVYREMADHLEYVADSARSRAQAA